MRQRRPNMPIARATRALLVTAALALAGAGCATPGAETPGGAPATEARPAEVGLKVHGLFTDNMVLQRGIALPVWGTAAPGRRITVAACGQTVSATVDRNGGWSLKLEPLAAGGPHEVRISGGGETIALENVLVGDVWLCSGQSNMAMAVKSCRDADKEIAGADLPRIRLYTVPRGISARPRTDVSSSWKVCSPESVPWFSGVGYFFGRHLHRRLDVPIGLIHASWGGTVAEAWTSAEALKTMPDFKEAVEGVERLAAEQQKANYDYEKKMAAWWAANDPGSAADGGWEADRFDDSGWQSMKLPGKWEKKGLEGLEDFDGVVWFRRTFDIPADKAGKPATLKLGPIDDRDVTWINGRRVGGMAKWSTPRKYGVPEGVLKAGRNSIAIRVLDTGGGGGIAGSPAQMKLVLSGGGDIPLAGDWRYAKTAVLSEATPVPRRLDGSPNTTTVLYNAMIAPLVPFAIKGAIWYQGESNSWRAEQYGRLLPTMIEDWRSRFGVGKFPFLVVQLANYQAEQKEPSEGGWALLREAQLLTATKDPMVGLAVAVDVGAARDIHPKDKQSVGLRLGLAAEAIAYGRDIVHSGPVYRSMSVDGSKVTLAFDHVGGGLIARGVEELKGFAIAGEDGSFEWAAAEIDGDTVVVSSARVPKPTAVRYGWASNPTCNLYNREGLPASPFRTDR